MAKNEQIKAVTSVEGQKPSVETGVDVLRKSPDTVDSVRRSPRLLKAFIASLIAACSNADTGRVSTDTVSYGDTISDMDGINENVEPMFSYGTPENLIIRGPNAVAVTGELIEGADVRFVFFDEAGTQIAEEMSRVGNNNVDGSEIAEVTIDPTLKPASVEILDSANSAWGGRQSLKAEPVIDFPEETN